MRLGLRAPDAGRKASRAGLGCEIRFGSSDANRLPADLAFRRNSSSDSHSIFFFFNIFFLKISNLKFGIGWNSTSDETDGWFEQHYIWSYILLQVVCSYWIVFIELVYLQRKQLWLNGLFTENHRASLELFDFWANLGGCWLISRSSSSSLSWQNLWQLCPNSCPPVSADTPILNWKTKTHEANSWRLRWWNQFTFVRGFG